MQRKLTSRTWGTAVLATALGVSACDGLTSPSEGETEVSLSIATTASGSNASLQAARAPVEGTSGEVLEITSLQLLIREVELMRQNRDECLEEDDACEKFETGAVLLDVPLDGSVITPFTQSVPPDTYEELEVEIKEPEDDNGDRARFREAHPDWPRKATVRIIGTFDAADGSGPQPIDVFLEVDAEIEREFPTPLVIQADDEASPVNLTLRIDVDNWLRRQDGGLIDPRELAGNEDLARLVQDNIERSLEAFRDDDRDGDDRD